MKVCMVVKELRWEKEKHLDLKEIERAMSVTLGNTSVKNISKFISLQKGHTYSSKVTPNNSITICEPMGPNCIKNTDE